MKQFVKVAIAASTLLVSGTSFASYLESCQFTATVKALNTVPTLNESVTAHTAIATLAITNAVDQHSHNPNACERRIGTDQQIIVKDLGAVAEGQEIKIDYFYVNGRAPNGIAFSERWTVIAD